MNDDDDLFPDPPFNMLISGVTGCGKTHLVLDLLANEFKGKYDYVLILCPTFLYNKTYDRRFIHEDPDVVPVVINSSEEHSQALHLNKILNGIIKIFRDKSEQTLIIIDDCANLHDTKLKSTALTQLAFHGRHINLSCWVITQKYNAIVKDFRENIKMLILFYDKDKKSRDAAFEENDTGVNEKSAVIETLKNNKNSKLIMQLFYPYKWSCRKC